MRVKYFAWVRERIGLAEEDLDPPAEVVTVGDFVGWLAARDETYAHALERPEVIRVALDQRHAPHGKPIAGAREIALFPPMTGG
jgi:molybdopterin synthase sulfur carrier subunit